MVTMPLGSPKSVLDAAGDAYDDMLRGLRASRTWRQATYAGGRDVPGGPVGNANAQVSQSQARLTGAPGVAAIVAGAVNRIAGSPNSSTEVKLKGGSLTVTRGPGADLHANLKRAPFNVEGSGRLEPPSGRREVRISKTSSDSKLISSMPSRVRIFNTDNGELRYEIDRPFRALHVPRIGYLIDTPAGQYIVGK